MKCYNQIRGSLLRYTVADRTAKHKLPYKNAPAPPLPEKIANDHLLELQPKDQALQPTSAYIDSNVPSPQIFQPRSLREDHTNITPDSTKNYQRSTLIFERTSLVVI